MSNDESVQPPNMDPVHDAIERLEWDDAKGEETPHSRLKALTRRTALTGGAAGLATAILTACGGGSGSSSSSGTTSTAKAQTSGGTPASGIFDSSKKFKFVFVNHVTTNPFFVPTRYGAEDACKLLGCSYQWTGSENSNVNEMVNAFNTAITGGADGIAVALVDAKAFNGPTDAALKAKIPVVSYNADSTENARLSYIGQDLFVSGAEMGKHIAELVPSGDVALFIATPGQANIQPRIDGAKDTLKSKSAIKPHVITTGAALPAELTVINSYATAHPETKGYFAVDAGSTQGLAQTIQKLNLRNKGVKGGGYDLTPDHPEAAGRRPDRLHHRSAALPAGLPARPRALPLQGLAGAVGHRRRQHGPEVPRQDHGRSLQQHQEPLRGHLVLARRDRGLAPRSDPSR